VQGNYRKEFNVRDDLSRKGIMIIERKFEGTASVFFNFKVVWSIYYRA
jgi:hypothetical protein